MQELTVKTLMINNIKLEDKLETLENKLDKIIKLIKNDSSSIDAIKTKTDNMPADLAATLTTIDTEVGQIKTKTDNMPVNLETYLDSIESNCETATGFSTFNAATTGVYIRYAGNSNKYGVYDGEINDEADISFGSNGRNGLTQVN